MHLCIGSDLRIADDHGFYVFACIHMHSLIVQFTSGGNGVAMLISLSLHTCTFGKFNMSLAKAAKKVGGGGRAQKPKMIEESMKLN